MFSQDFTVFGGSLGRGLRREDLQGHGSRAALRLPGDRHQRLGRGAHPGRRRGARRLRRDLPPQRHGLGRRAADLARDGPVRGRRGLLARDHRLRADDARHLAHVHHRPRGRAHRDRRGGLVRGPRRRRHARAALGRRAPRGRRRGRALRRGALPAHVPAAEQPRARAARAHRRPARPLRRRAGHDHPRLAHAAVRHEGGRPAHRRRRRLLRDPRALRREHRLRLRAAGRPRRRHRRQPAAGAGGRARHRLLRQGGALRAHLRRVRPADRHVRRRSGVPARHGAGVERDHPPRRQAALRLLRGELAQARRDHAQGLRRRLRRDELQARRAPTSTSPGRRPRSR